MNKVSAVIITKNEEKNIERCLKSLSGWTDEIVLVDSGSEDKTLEIAKKYNCRIFHLEKWEGFGKTKQYAVNQAKNDWVFSIDADEEVTDDLKNTIKKVLETPEEKLYKIKRKSYYLGRLINHCGWNNDYPKRLFDKNYANFNDKLVHESVVYDGKIGVINDFILHYTYPDISSHLQKIDKYTDLSALENNKGLPGIFSSIARAKAKFFKMYIFQKAFLDGKEGFILSLISSFGILIKYLKIREIRK